LRIAQPLLMAALVTSLGVANQLAREGIVVCAIPTAVLSTLLAPRYRLYEVESSSNCRDCIVDDRYIANCHFLNVDLSCIQPAKGYLPQRRAKAAK
jgi:hypothetical protein